MDAEIPEDLRTKVEGAVFDCTRRDASFLRAYISDLLLSERIAAEGRAMERADIDNAARHLRETLQAGKTLTPWKMTPNATKKKWLALAEGTLRAAAIRNA